MLSVLFKKLPPLLDNLHLNYMVALGKSFSAEKIHSITKTQSCLFEGLGFHYIIHYMASISNFPLRNLINMKNKCLFTGVNLFNPLLEFINSTCCKEISFGGISVYFQVKFQLKVTFCFRVFFRTMFQYIFHKTKYLKGAVLRRHTHS